MENSYVYILANKRNGTLYVGSTTDLVKRIWQHKNKITGGFTAKYNVDKLVYFEECEDILVAGERENKIKNRSRKWKIALIEKNNAAWKDLFEEICD